MAESVAATPSTSKAAAPRPTPVRDLWSQGPGENDLWYIRFLRYVALGPGRSVSLVATGERNHYPVPAHWPVQAKQLSWRTRAAAFDAAALKDPRLVKTFNGLLASLLPNARAGGEAERLAATIKTGGYQIPPELDENDPAWTGEPNPRYADER